MLYYKPIHPLRGVIAWGVAIYMYEYVRDTHSHAAINYYRIWSKTASIAVGKGGGVRLLVYIHWPLIQTPCLHPRLHTRAQLQ